MVSTVSFLFLSYWVLISKTICKKINLPDLESLGSQKLEECTRCKILVESFNHWLDKTSRGKYEGGDAAWEEAKLKSYSRSEVRLVEIQENLCSDVKKHQNQCYGLAEEVEQVLEKWWFHENPVSTDLLTWLCIENLQYCCPPLHYGDACYPCPLDNNNKVCNGHGSCHGEGTRKGNGTCICNSGFTGHNCGDCAKNYYLNLESCAPCHKSCDGCYGADANACLACNKGWQLQSGKCVDIDECLIPSSCKQNQYCLNLEGTYLCKSCDKSCLTCIGKGQGNCTSCEADFLLWSGACLSEMQKSDILNDTRNRLILYIGLFIIAFIIFRTSRSLSSIVILVIAVYIYYSEKESYMNCVDVLQNFYFVP